MSPYGEKVKYLVDVAKAQSASVGLWFLGKTAWFLHSSKVSVQQKFRSFLSFLEFPMDIHKALTC